MTMRSGVLGLLTLVVMALSLVVAGRFGVTSELSALIRLVALGYALTLLVVSLRLSWLMGGRPLVLGVLVLLVVMSFWSDLWYNMTHGGWGREYMEKL